MPQLTPGHGASKLWSWGSVIAGVRCEDMKSRADRQKAVSEQMRYDVSRRPIRRPQRAIYCDPYLRKDRTYPALQPAVLRVTACSPPGWYNKLD